ncbi:hypothetical protein ccbrp13_41410 [Ktedonobacteria bacterium brp13]|nr:hypothetical protein ccbrp13_41410 [Ktedonobacteria bacterium brp13]
MANKEKNSYRRLNFSSAVHPSLLQLIVIDIVCPYMIYPLLQPRIAPPLALLLVALFPLASVIFGALRHNQPDPLGIAALYVIACVLLSQYLPLPALPLRSALFVAIPGLIVLATQPLHQPLAAYVESYAQSLVREQAETEQQPALDHTSEQQHIPGGMRLVNMVWGIGQLGIACILAGCTLVATQDLYTLLVPGIIALGYLALIIWTIQYWDGHKG